MRNAIQRKEVFMYYGNIILAILPLVESVLFLITS